MPCNLIILGKKLDIDALITKSKLRGYLMHYKGQPRFKSKPDGIKLIRSSVAKQISKADFSNLDQQIMDTIRYLKRHRDKLAIIKKTKEIELAVLDFGIRLSIDGKKTIFQSERFPNELLELAGSIGLSIELSIYPIEKENSLEKQTRTRKPKIV